MSTVASDSAEADAGDPADPGAGSLAETSVAEVEDGDDENSKER